MFMLEYIPFVIYFQNTMHAILQEKSWGKREGVKQGWGSWNEVRKLFYKKVSPAPLQKSIYLLYEEMGMILNFKINTNIEDDSYMVDLDLRPLRDLDLEDQSRMQDHFNSGLGIYS